MLASHWGEMAQLQEGIEEQEQCKTEEEEWGGTRCSQLQKHLCVVSVPSVAAIFCLKPQPFLFSI